MHRHGRRGGPRRGSGLRRRRSAANDDAMDLDALLDHFFGTADLDDLDEAAIEAGRERASIAFGTERDPGRRFALWILLHATGGAPDPSIAFKNAADRKAAEDYAWAARRMERD